MEFPNIPYQSYTWVLGTTTFRVSQLNYKIEKILILLQQLQNQVKERGQHWSWSDEQQRKLYQLMHAEGVLVGSASLPDKDARQKTSGLVELGLATDSRELTQVGSKILSLVENADFSGENHFMIPADSYLYFKQLLKTSLATNDSTWVRPYLVLAYLLNRFEYLTNDEFSFLMPLVNDVRTLEIVCKGIETLREDKNTNIYDLVYQLLISMDNMQEARELWLAHQVSADLLIAIGMNRKSRQYSKTYLPVYEALSEIYLNQANSKQSLLNLYDAVKGISGKPKHIWRRMLFGKVSRTRVAKLEGKSLSENNPFHGIKTEEALKNEFFKQLHLNKAVATLEDYSDLNRRYLKLTDTIIFEDQMVRFDVIPKAYFSIVEDYLTNEMFTRSQVLTLDVPMSVISPMLDVPESTLVQVLSSEFGVELGSLQKAKQSINSERYDRLHSLLNKRFHSDVMLELLECFEKRNDKRIAELVNDSATPSTAFEYILGLIWYDLSGRNGNILDYMKLQLEADLTPRTHASGGYADIVYEYEKDQNYPAHSALIEVTLADGTAERLMEMEPVSRHLGNQIGKSGNAKDYCIFVAPHLNINLVSDFRSRKNHTYFYNAGNEQIEINGLKIIPLEIEDIKQFIRNRATYSNLYQTFEDAYQLDTNHPIEWQKELDQLLLSNNLISPVAISSSTSEELMAGPNPKMVPAGQVLPTDRKNQSNKFD